MKNNDFAMLIVVILFIALASSGMSMVTGSSSVTAEAGSVVEIPWSYTYNNDDFFGSSTLSRITLDSSQNSVDEVVWSKTVSADQTYSGSINYQVPGVEGVYNVILQAEDWSGSDWIRAGDFTITITVTPKPYVEPEVPEVPNVPETPAGDESGVVPGDTPINQTAEAAMLGGTLMDKVSVLWDLIVTFFEQLLGAK